MFLECAFSFLLHADAVTFPKQAVVVDQIKLNAEIARTPEQHEQGLMFRRSINDDQAMLFIFPNEETRYFWMKNTFIALSIGYFDAGGVLIDIQDMAPVKSEMEQNPPTYPSRAPAKFALEVAQGWFARKKIQVGAHLTNLKSLVNK